MSSRARFFKSATRATLFCRGERVFFLGRKAGFFLGLVCRLDFDLDLDPDLDLVVFGAFLVRDEAGLVLREPGFLVA